MIGSVVCSGSRINEDTFQKFEGLGRRSPCLFSSVFMISDGWVSMPRSCLLRVAGEDSLYGLRCCEDSSASNLIDARSAVASSNEPCLSIRSVCSRSSTCLLSRATSALRL